MKKKITGAVAAALALGTVVPASFASAASFTDIDSSYAKDAINALADQGVVAGTSATTFSPTAQLTREQFATFIVKAKDFSESTTDAGFTDNKSGNWYYGWVNAAKANNIMVGVSATEFGVGQAMTREAAAVAIVKAFGYEEQVDANAETSFSDDASISSWAKGYVALAQDKGLVAGADGAFNPKQQMDRQMAAAMVKNSLDVVENKGRIVLTPDTDADVDNGSARSFSATFYNADGSLYTGSVGLELSSVDDDDKADFDLETETKFVSVDGNSISGEEQEWTGFAGSDGKVTFIVQNVDGSGEVDVAPVVWIDSDGDGDRESDEGDAPEEAYAVGGITTFGKVITDAVTAGYTNEMSVDSVGSDNFVVDSAVYSGGTITNAKFTFDDNDIFMIEGSYASLTEFEAALNDGDKVKVSTYDDDEDGVSIFNISDDTDDVADLEVNEPDDNVDANNYLLSGTGQAGYTVKVYVYNTSTKLAQTTVNSNGEWSATVPLKQDDDNKFTVKIFKYSDGDSVESEDVTVTEGSGDFTLLDTDGAYVSEPVNNDNKLGKEDLITLVFDDDVAEVEDGAKLTLQDSDGTVVSLTVGTNVEEESRTGNTLVLKVTRFPAIENAGGSDVTQENIFNLDGQAEITAITGIESKDGSAIKSESDDDVVLDEK